MVDESSGISTASPLPPSEAPGLSGARYGLLRWSIRLTGLVLMLAGVACLTFAACNLLRGQHQSHDLPYTIVVSLLVLGVVILALRTGFRMLLLVDVTTIRQFSFIFALVYTVVLLNILPQSDLQLNHPVLVFILVGFFLGLSYWVLNRILSALLLPSKKR